MYRPPALRGLSSRHSPSNDSPSVATPEDDSILSPTNHPPGFRRARAGTLPSNVQLAAQQRFTESPIPLPNALQLQDSLLDQTQRTLTGTSASNLALSRPLLRHTASVATERTNRLRAGSLTLPPAGLSNPFSLSLFPNPWMPSSNNSGSGIPVLEERSVTSADSDTEAFDVHTLNYLGLDDHRPPAATLSELHNQALSMNPNRMRASTVSVYGRRPQATSIMAGSADEVEEDYFTGDYSDHSYSHQPQHLTPSYDAQIHDNGYTSSYLGQATRATESLSVTRPRAISVGTLDDPVRSITRRATFTTDTLPYLSEINHQTTNLNLVSNNLGNPPSILKSDNKLAGSRMSSTPSVHFPNGEVQGSGKGTSAYLLAPNSQTSQNRSVSPKSEGQSSQMQTPTRSLWIGNLDSSVTSEQLIHVFAPYGAIESLRLLPEKVCPAVFLIVVGFEPLFIQRNAVSLILLIKPMLSVPRTMF